MTFNFFCAFIVAASFNVVLTAEATAEDYHGESNTEKPVGRAYSISTCDYASQVGYSCLSCHRALHCYPGNAAILVDCAGLFRYCRDGRCSRFQGSKCFSDNKLTTLAPASDATLPTTTNNNNTSTETVNVDPTVIADGTSKVVTETVFEAVSSPIAPKETTKSVPSLSNEDNNVVSSLK